MISRNIKDHRDIGLNAAWCISAYQIDKDVFIFDNEDMDETYSLCHVQPEPDGTYSGSFAECVKYYEEEVKK